MNWLNAVDNILDGAFAPGQETDDEDTSHYGSSVTSTDNLGESGAWSDDDEESEHEHNRLAFSVPEDVIDEEDESELAKEDDNDNDDEKAQKKTPAAKTPSRPVPGMARPGNIRVMHKQLSSSSEEESDDENDSEEKLNSNVQKTNPQNNTKPSPIALSEEDSLLKKKPENATTGSETDSAQQKQPPSSTDSSDEAGTSSEQQSDSPTKARHKLHPSNWIKRSIDTTNNNNSVSTESQTQEDIIHPNNSEHSSDNHTNATTEAVHDHPDSPNKSQVISDDAEESLVTTPVLNNKQSARAATNNREDPPKNQQQSSPIEMEAPQKKEEPSALETKANNKDNDDDDDDDLDDSVRAMAAELEALKAAVESIENERGGSDNIQDLTNSAMDNSASLQYSEDTGIILSSETSQTNSCEANKKSPVEQGSDHDDDEFADAEHDHSLPESTNGKTMSALEETFAGSANSQSTDEPSQIIGEDTTAPESPPTANDDINMRDTLPGESSFQGIRHSEATLPVVNLRESLSETTDGMSDDDGASDDGSIGFDGISGDNRKETLIQNSVSDETLSSNDVSRDIQNQTSGGTPDKSDLVRSSVHFKVDEALNSWEEDPADAELDPQEMNCYGAFHIRVLRAQRLPCSVGSTVQASVSLLPWKGRFRSERRVTFVLEQESSASFDHGVCAQWDDKKGDPSTTISLIHAYVSEATPIPTMKINLVVSPVKMLEFSMCSLTLPCGALMKTPGKWHRQWFFSEMEEKKSGQDSQLFSQEQTALIEVEAIFVPDDQSLGSSFVSIGQGQKVPGQDDDDISESSQPIETAHEVPTPVAANAARQDDNFVASTKPHLLRAHKFWKPASCASCSKSLMGWRSQSFRCEMCGLDCCSDCRLHVDLQLPCGSEKAADVVSKLIQNRLTVSSFLETMAPVDDSYEQKKRSHLDSLDGESSLADARSLGGTTHTTRVDRGRIGVMKMNIARACVFQNPLPAITEPHVLLNHTGELRPGDYYVRVCRTGTEGSARTRTIPSPGRLKFEDSSEMRLDVSHYGVDFFIEVVDALTDKPVGTGVITTQGILQQQRDLMIERGTMSILNVGKKPPVFKGKQRLVLELRTGVKSGVSSDFFVPSDSNSEQGEISGWIEITAGLEEDVKRLYGPVPYECPPRPADTLNLSLLSLHISRLSDFLEDIGNLFSTYQYIVSWKNPILTGFSFVVFLSLTLKFNAEYVGCLPFLFLMLCMLPQAATRSVGASKNRFVQEEADEWNAAEKDIDVNYSVHRPVGTVNINITKGRNIRSRDTGLAGNVGCRVYWDPLRLAKENQKEKAQKIDKSTMTVHDIGSTVSKFTTNPTWDRFKESDESRRLKQVLPHHGHFFETEEELAHESGYDFPVLQPFRKVEDEEADESPQHFNAALEPWTASTGSVVFQIRFRDILNMLPGSDHIFGEVSVPLSTLIEKGEVSGWFQVLEVGSKEFVLVDQQPHGTPMPELLDDMSVLSGISEAALSKSDVPQVFLTLKWSPPETDLDTQEAEETQREASIVIQEELLRWAVIHRDQDKYRQLVVGGSIGAFNRISGLAGYLQIIQNFLGLAADSIEGARNLLNFTDPYKSSMLLAVVSILWFILCLLPTRVIILVAGLAQYGLTLKTRLNKVLRSKAEQEMHRNDDDVSQASDLDDDESDGMPIGVWLANAFRGIPTDEDLRKTYFWEGRRIGAKIRETYANEKRLARLKRLWRAQWHATVKIRDVKAKGEPKNAWVWKTAFAVVQGRRFLWWNTVKDFDSGETPLGRIFLAGHAGLSGLSPLEMREIDSKEVPFVVGIFGRGLEDQQRVTLLLPSAELKDSLENAVIDASVKED